MDASDLRVFEAVARLGGMNRAAGELNTVQSNVTNRIRNLEDELGSPLFSRHSRGVSLTPAGRRLLPYAHQAASLLDDARRAVRDDGNPSGALVIGSLETTAAMHLPPILAEYVKAHPDVDLSLTTGTTEELIGRVLDRQLEGALVCGPVDHPELEQETIFREELAVITSRAVRNFDDLAAKGGLKIVVLRIGCSYRQRLESILARRGVADLRKLEFGTLDAILGCVAAGIGVTLLPKGMAPNDKVPPGSSRGPYAIHRLPPEEARVETVFIRRRDAYASSAFNAFLDCLRPHPVLAAAAK